MQTETRAENRWLVALSLAFLAFVYVWFGVAHSPDLAATWLAGHFFGSSQSELVYPKDDGVFTMLIPEAWWDFLKSEGREGIYYPFLYPPLWAWAAGEVGSYIGMDGFVAIFGFLNPILLLGTSVFATRACGVTGRPRLLWLATGIVAPLATSIGLVAIEQNQPQILVTFLVVAAIERDRAGAWKAAGALLALAAAIKLYPALLAVLWLGERRWRSLATFGVVGALLGVSSIAVAGWPLHTEYLGLIALLRESVVVTSFNYDLDSALAQIFWYDDLVFVASRDNPIGIAYPHGWKVLAKGPVWPLITTTALLGMTVATALHAWRSARPLVILTYPAFLALLAFLAPLSWGYHFLSTLAFAPALLVALGPARGAALLAIILLPMSPVVFWLFSEPIDGFLVNPVLGTVGVASLGLALWRVRHRV